MRTTVTLDPDVVAALRAGMRQRGVSFKEALNSAVRAGLAAPRSAVFAQPLSADEALDLVDGWLAQPCVAVVHPTERHATILRTLLADVGTAANMTSDAHLAALALEHGAVLYSSDADFSRFSGIRWVDPLRA